MTTEERNRIYCPRKGMCSNCSMMELRAIPGVKKEWKFCKWYSDFCKWVSRNCKGPKY